MIDIDSWIFLIIVALAVVTVITRSFFLFSDKPWHMPHWAERGLQYAPIAALAAVVIPLMRDAKYNVPRSAGLIAGAGCIAPILPPGCCRGVAMGLG